MRLAITPDHKEFFNKNGYLELEGLLSVSMVADIKKSIEETIAARLKVPVAKLSTQPAASLFQAGYDLWRDNEVVKRVAQKKDFALLASELFQLTSLRLAFDAYVCATNGSPFPERLTLQETSCLSPLAGALILPLTDLLQPIPLFSMPLNAGNGLFISPSLPIPWPELFATEGLCFLIIAFSNRRTLFCPDTRDPHAVNLKRLGYVFNDKLSDSLHPILVRK
jgi:hypothetical protein